MDSSLIIDGSFSSWILFTTFKLFGGNIFVPSLQSIKKYLSMYLLGYDIGSSSLKVALLKASSGETIKVIQFPETELEIRSVQLGWAEQNPEVWWENLCQATKLLLEETAIDPSLIKGIGIAYQMHGLVLVDQNQQVLRPSIIWCDSRAVEIGNEAFSAIGKGKCLSHLLNSPGNFTASKLKWVKENEPDVYQKIYKILLPGDYIAMKLTGEIKTTVSGLSEGIFWDFKNESLANFLLDYYQLSTDLLPGITKTFGIQGKVNQAAAAATGLAVGIPVSYRAGDQPNNAMSLGVFEPGEIAATGGTSGVVYGIVDHPVYDLKSRINGFAHINHSKENPRIGLLLCINGAGILYSWIKKQMAYPDITYDQMEERARNVSVGSEGLRIIPFGNGAERIIENKSPGAQINNLQLNLHHQAHFYRAALEGIAFSYVYGCRILQDLGITARVIKVGNDNLFRSAIFSQTISNLLNARIEVVKTTGAAGAAKASGIGVGEYRDLKEAIKTNEVERVYTPAASIELYQKAYFYWTIDLQKQLKNV